MTPEAQPSLGDSSSHRSGWPLSPGGTGGSEGANKWNKPIHCIQHCFSPLYIIISMSNSVEHLDGILTSEWLYTCRKKSLWVISWISSSETSSGKNLALNLNCSGFSFFTSCWVTWMKKTTSSSNHPFISLCVTQLHACDFGLLCELCWFYIIISFNRYHSRTVIYKHIHHITLL